MIPDPLHPAVVHFPIVFAVLLPIVAIAALIVIRNGADARGAWIPVVALAAGLAGSAWFAVETGEDQEEVVEQVVVRSAIHDHEEAAELFLYLSGAVFLLVSTGLLSSHPGRIGRGMGTAAAVVVLVAGARVGHSGGLLVYEHGAASAYVVGSAATDEARPNADRADRDDEQERSQALESDDDRR